GSSAYIMLVAILRLSCWVHPSGKHGTTSNRWMVTTNIRATSWHRAFELLASDVADQVGVVLLAVGGQVDAVAGEAVARAVVRQRVPVEVPDVAAGVGGGLQDLVVPRRPRAVAADVDEDHVLETAQRLQQGVDGLLRD